MTNPTQLIEQLETALNNAEDAISNCQTLLGSLRPKGFAETCMEANNIAQSLIAPALTAARAHLEQPTEDRAAMDAQGAAFYVNKEQGFVVTAKEWAGYLMTQDDYAPLFTHALPAQPAEPVNAEQGWSLLELAADLVAIAQELKDPRVPLKTAVEISIREIGEAAKTALDLYRAQAAQPAVEVPTEPKPKGLFIDLIAEQGPEFVAEMAAIKIEPAPSTAGEACRTCGGTGIDGDSGPDGSTIEVPCHCTGPKDLNAAVTNALKAWQTSCYGQPAHQKAMLFAMTDLNAALLQSTALPDHSEQHLDMVSALPVGELEAFEAWFLSHKLESFPKDYDRRRLEGWGEHYRSTAWDAWQGRAILAAARSQPVREPLTADMFWNHDDAEQLYSSIEEFLNDEICNGAPLEVGDTRTIQRAVRLSNLEIRVTSIDEESCDAEYEVVQAAHGITQGGKV